MKVFNKVLGGVAALSLALSLVGPVPTVLAASNPPASVADTYGILSNLFQHNVAGTTVNGDPATPGAGVLGYSSEAGAGAVVVTNGTTEVASAAYTAAGNAQNGALVNLNNQVGCISLGGGAVNLDAIDIDGAGPILPGHYTPGCYTSGGPMNITVGQTVTLDGDGTYIFRPAGALTTEANTNVALNGASACDVFWTPTAATTLGANSTFSGTIIDPSGVTVGDVQTINGRIWAYGGTVTAATLTVNVPICAAAVPPPSSSDRNYNITVSKIIINDNGGTITDTGAFQAQINGTNVDFDTPYYYPVPSTPFVVTETPSANYTTTFSGACNADGVVNTDPGDTKVCVITNDDIGAPVVVPPVPPLIDVVKVPSPLALPAGPGPVTYTYTVRNIGTVPMTNVALVGDTCSPIIRSSGDVNNNNILEVSEVWTYVCATTLTETHTNTVVATGLANGITARDVASARVVVGAAVVPPLINVTKIPSPLTLPFGGGMVTYTFRVTNPGTVALNNVVISDSKCAPLTYISGDINGDLKLDTTETWTYTCRTNVTANTTNVVEARGDANGFTVNDVAIAPIIVAGIVPTLPATGIISSENIFNLLMGGAGIIAISMLLFVIKKRQEA